MKQLGLPKRTPEARAPTSDIQGRLPRHPWRTITQTFDELCMNKYRSAWVVSTTHLFYPPHPVSITSATNVRVPSNDASTSTAIAYLTRSRGHSNVKHVTKPSQEGEEIYQNSGRLLTQLLTSQWYFTTTHHSSWSNPQRSWELAKGCKSMQELHAVQAAM